MKQFVLRIIFAASLFSVLPAQAQQVVSVDFLNTAPRFLFALFSGEARFDVDVYKVLYTTPDVQGVTDTASGLLALPASNSTGFPTVIIHHGTVFSRDEVPSNLEAFWEFGGLAASVGYAAILPDYLGLGESRGFHPYLHAATEASASVDMFIALQDYFSENDIPVNGQLFLTGYSQGGHASMASHQLLETSYAEAYPVTAAAHLSGPYSVSVGFKNAMLSDEPYFSPAFPTWTILSYNEVYGLYDSLQQYMEEPYAGYAMQYYQGEINLDSLNTLMLTQLSLDHGAPIVREMFQDSLIQAIQVDDNHPLNVALRDNDTYNWAPEAPTRLFYCMGDQTVGFENSIIADSILNANGAVDLASVDVGPDLNHIDCVLPAGLATLDFFGLYANFDAVTATQDIPQLEGVSAFPNPARNVVQLTGLPAGSTLQIFNLNGQLLRTDRIRAQSATVPVNQLHNGMYLFRIVAEQGTWNEQVLIQR